MKQHEIFYPMVQTRLLYLHVLKNDSSNKMMDKFYNWDKMIKHVEIKELAPRCPRLTLGGPKMTPGSPELTPGGPELTAVGSSRPMEAPVDPWRPQVEPWRAPVDPWMI